MLDRLQKAVTEACAASPYVGHIVILGLLRAERSDFKRITEKEKNA